MLSARIALFARAYYSYVKNKLICKDSLICKLANKPILINKLIQSDVSDIHSEAKKHIVVYFTIVTRT